MLGVEMAKSYCKSKKLKKRSKTLGSPRLQRMQKRLDADQNEMKKGNWRKARKRMVKTTYEFESQQAY